MKLNWKALIEGGEKNQQHFSTSPKLHFNQITLNFLNLLAADDDSNNRVSLQCY